MAKSSSVVIGTEVIIESSPIKPSEVKNSYEEKVTKLDEIMKHVRILEEQVNSFNADKDGNEFKSLVESLTKHLESIDGIETCGIGHILQKHKEIVVIINSLLSNLESKPANVPNVTELSTISSFIDEALAPVEVQETFQEVSTAPVSENCDTVSTYMLALFESICNTFVNLSLFFFDYTPLYVEAREELDKFFRSFWKN